MRTIDAAHTVMMIIFKYLTRVVCPHYKIIPTEILTFSSRSFDLDYFVSTRFRNPSYSHRFRFMDVRCGANHLRSSHLFYNPLAPEIITHLRPKYFQ